ncbi:MAG: hypothetical protein EBX16_08265 [Burkholderiaceae bacterium]|nr:hypothetical protein [Burkholderiaceae bacterium]
MKFNIYPPETPIAIDPSWKIDSRFIGKTIEREGERQPYGGFYPSATDLGVPMELLRVDPAQGLMFKLHGGSIAEFIGSETMAVICGPNGKMQFKAQIVKANEKGELIAAIPNELILIQRRKQFRTLAPPDEDFNFVLSLGAGQELLTKVIDISAGGILLDIRLEATQVDIGRYWHSCYFERLKSRSGPIDLQIKNNRPGALLDRIRVGCELYEPSTRVLKEMESTRSAIENARVASKLNRWYLNASWYD